MLNDPEKKGISRPSRDKLEVGLARHKKPDTFKLPRWFVEYGGWGFAFVLLMGFLLGSYWYADAMFFSAETSDDLTSLSSVGSPKKIWKEGSATVIKTIKLRVGNAGAHTAKRVEVFALMGRKRVAFVGPASIEVGKSEVFTLEADIDERPGRELLFEYECQNCEGVGRL
jgi:hypothetical protein